MRSTGDARPEILFATIAAGGGHLATARAMAEAVERHYPGRFGLRVSDYMKDVGVTDFDRRHKESWRRALGFPALVVAGQRLIDAFPRITVAGQGRLLRGFARAAAEDLKTDPPLLVVSNHGLVTTGLAEAKRLFGLEVPVLTFAHEPNGEISAYWADPRADRVVAPSRETSSDLARLGVPAEKIEVLGDPATYPVGYPVRGAFLDAPGKAEARARLDLPEGFTCLVGFGAEGVGTRQRRMVEELLGAGPNFRVVAVTGRNEALRKDLAGIRSDRLRVEGFVGDMASYLAAGDVFVGKAGPGSVYEALAVGRPVILTGYAALNERAVTRFVGREGLGSYAPATATLVREVRRYAQDPALLEEAARRCRALNLAGATESLARYVVRYAQCHTPGGAPGDGV